METLIPKIPGYQLQKCLGAGGMGVVYLATRPGIEFQYAIKMLLAGRNASIEDLVRFRIEAEAYACLNHRNIIKIRDVGVVSGCPYLAMDYAGNGSLHSHLKNNPLLNVEWRVRTIKLVAEALSHAHGRRILHRDLKPANILISADGDPRVTDFGLVKFSAPIAQVSESCCTMSPAALDEHLLWIVNENRQRIPVTGHDIDYDTIVQQISVKYSQQVGSDHEMMDNTKIRSFVNRSVETRRFSGELSGLLDEKTRAGTVMGSPQFMSPEQAQGAIDRIRPQTDVYGLGATLYKILTDRPPILGQNTMEVIRNILNTDPIPPALLNPSVSESLSLVVMKAIEKKPEDRYPNMEMFGEDLDRVLTGKKTIAQLHSHVRSRKFSMRSMIHKVASSFSQMLSSQRNALETTIVQEECDQVDVSQAKKRK